MTPHGNFAHPHRGERSERAPARFSNRKTSMMWLRRHAAKTCFWLADRFTDLGYFFSRPIREMAERLEGRR